MDEQREPIEIPPELVREIRPGKPSRSGRVLRRPVRDAVRPQSGLLQVERPVAPSSRSKPAQRLLSVPRASSGHVVWRDIPSWYQQREPSREPALVHATKSPPWVRRRKARTRARLQKASRRVNRG